MSICNPVRHEGAKAPIRVYFAHSENAAGAKHDLVQHLESVAALARKFAAKFGAEDFGYWSGLWHDLGKFSYEFQSYLAAPASRRGPDHSTTGAIHACAAFEPLAFLVAGHHSGMPSPNDLKRRVKDKEKIALAQKTLDVARGIISTLAPGASLEDKLPASLREKSLPAVHQKRTTELFLRMVFSALVDADFLDTEKHFESERSLRRGGAPSLSELWQRFEASQAKLSGQKHDSLNEIRHEIYGHCLNAADFPPGIFRLTVPTSGGKTRSGMAFALCHALRHGHDRVIVAIPYTSIIEQTADVYRKIFHNGSRDAVLEHHSAVMSRQESEDPVTYDEMWSRLASENWDAPVVVTTTVQLFESLFANRPSPCRKLHNIVGSVVILDEVQCVPTHLLHPILDVLQQLVENYRVTAVLCTATQPALTENRYLRGLRNVREIVPEPARYFEKLKRVHFEHVSEPWPWGRVAQEMQSLPQSLAVVNTKRDAFSLLDAINDPAALHLSTQMCGVHRLETLREVRRRLSAQEPCRLVSTQVVEAGVDLDFPLVLRAIGPLDRIVQAAGRCNREGKLSAGRVVIFEPMEGSSPPGIYCTGMETAAVLLKAGCDLHDPNTYERYFQLIFQAADLDAKQIQAAREQFDYPTVAKAFRMIDDDSAPAVVRPEGHKGTVDSLLVVIRGRAEAPRWAFRRLQPYVVSIRAWLIPAFQNKGLLQEIVPGLWEWLGSYDSVRGLVEGARGPTELVI